MKLKDFFKCTLILAQQLKLYPCDRYFVNFLSINDTTILAMNTDGIVARDDHDPSYGVQLTSKDEWEENWESLTQGSCWYIDGSKTSS